MSESMSQPGVGVASRILALLGVFDTTHRRLSLTEMACRAELPLSTVHRMVAEPNSKAGVPCRASPAVDT